MDGPHADGLRPYFNSGPAKAGGLDIGILIAIVSRPFRHGKQGCLSANAAWSCVFLLACTLALQDVSHVQFPQLGQCR